MIDLVCSVCGSNDWRDKQRSVDERYPIARCQAHRATREPWSALIPRAEFHKRQRAASAPPEDVFGGLSDDERAALRKPISSRPLG